MLHAPVNPPPNPLYRLYAELHESSSLEDLIRMVEQSSDVDEFANHMAERYRNGYYRWAESAEKVRGASRSFAAWWWGVAP